MSLELADSILSDRKWPVESSIASFDRFVNRDLPDIVSKTSDFPMRIADSQYRIRFSGVTLRMPNTASSVGSSGVMNRRMLPSEARKSRSTYAASLHVDVNIDHQEPDGSWKKCSPTNHDVHVGNIPVMVGSCLCWTSMEEIRLAEVAAGKECEVDPGGYFIFRGTEKAMMMLERGFMNRPSMFSPGVSECRSTFPDRQNVFCSTVVRLTQSKGPSSKGTFGPGDSVMVQLPYLQKESSCVPLGAVMAALGVHSVSEACKVCCRSDPSDPGRERRSRAFLKRIMGEQESLFGDTEAAMELIGGHISSSSDSRRKKKVDETPLEAARKSIRSNMLPHVQDPEAKAAFLGSMVADVLDHRAGRKVLDDRDDFANKRLVCVGDFFSSHFQTSMYQFACDLRNSLTKSANNSRGSKGGTIFRSNLGQLSTTRGGVTSTLRGLVSGTGEGSSPSFGGVGMVPKVSYDSGANQTVSRLSYLSAVSVHRRMLSTVGKDGKATGHRQLHISQYGRVCPSETPEGASIGLLKNLANGARVTAPGSWKCLVKVAEAALKPDPLSSDSKVLLFVGGVPIGRIAEERASGCADRVVGMRRAGLLDPHTSVCFEPGVCLRLGVDPGRIVAPRVVCGISGEPLATPEVMRSLSWKEVMRAGLGEELDSEEEAMHCFVSGSRPPSGVAPTHRDVHPSLILGMCASFIPFANHNQSPRNTYQSAMCKQAVGIPISNHHEDPSRGVHVMNYPHMPIVSTRSLRVMHPILSYSGFNAVVAIMNMDGMNIEDSCIMNLAAVQRGMFRSTHKIFSKTEVQHSSMEITADPTRKPKTMVCHDPTAYASLDMDGTPSVGSVVKAGDVIVGKLSYVKGSTSGYDYYDRSQVSKGLDGGQVVSVSKTKIEQSGSVVVMVDVGVCKQEIPMVGDKFASRHAQKSIVGAMLRQEDMPFTASGVVPEIIMNPHTITSRMTVGHVMEMVAGKVACAGLRSFDATSFCKFELGDSTEDFMERGVKCLGREAMFNGRTGEMYPELASIGIIYYQKLNHMVASKIQFRGTGRRTQMTMQPVEGRSREGGLKFGEMEKDCAVAHGATAVVMDRLRVCSDDYRLHLDQEGNVAVANAKGGSQVTVEYSKTWDEGTNSRVVQVPVTYAAKLVFQEMQSMMIGVRMVPSASMT